MPAIVNYELDSDFFEGGSLHRTGTFVITVSGVLAAAKATPSMITSVLYGPCGVPVNGILDLYRFSQPTRWYLNLKPDIPLSVVGALHGKQVDVKSEGVSVMIEDLERERKKMTLHWLPSTATVAGVKKLVEQLTGDAEAEAFKLNDFSGRWGVMCRPSKDVPHYITISNPSVMREKLEVLVTIKGRRTVCPTCGLDTHWSSQCPRKNPKSTPPLPLLQRNISQITTPSTTQKTPARTYATAAASTKATVQVSPQHSPKSVKSAVIETKETEEQQLPEITLGHFTPTASSKTRKRQHKLKNQASKATVSAEEDESPNPTPQKKEKSRQDCSRTSSDTEDESDKVPLKYLTIKNDT